MDFNRTNDIGSAMLYTLIMITICIIKEIKE
jgi:hypothetical protein